MKGKFIVFLGTGNVAQSSDALSVGSSGPPSLSPHLGSPGGVHRGQAVQGGQGVQGGQSSGSVGRPDGRTPPQITSPSSAIGLPTNQTTGKIKKGRRKDKNGGEGSAKLSISSLSRMAAIFKQ